MLAGRWLLLLPLVHASSYLDGGTDLACWKAKTFVDCEVNFPGVDLWVDWMGMDLPTTDPDHKVTRVGDLVSINSLFTYPDSTQWPLQIKEHAAARVHSQHPSARALAHFCWGGGGGGYGVGLDC